MWILICCLSCKHLWSHFRAQLNLTHLSPYTTSKKDRDLSCVNFGVAWAGHLARRNGELVTRVLTLSSPRTVPIVHHCVFLLSSVSFSRSFAAPPLLVRCWLVRRDDGLKATGGAVVAAAALCPCPSSLFLLFFSSLPLFLFPSPASSAPLFANVPCQSPRSPLSPLFAPFR